MSVPFSLSSSQDLVPVGWKGPLAMAIGLHLALFLLAFYMPSLLERSYERPEFYTVNLVSMGEIGGPAAPAPAAKEITPDKDQVETKAEPPPIPPSPAKEEVKVEKPLPEPKPEPLVVPPPEKMAIPEPKPAPKEIISLEPSKAMTKVKEQKKVAEQKVKEETKLTKALTRIQANVQEKEAKAEANKATKEALNALRQTIRMGDQTGTSGGPKSGSGGPSGGGGPILDLAYRSYLALIHQRIQEHWILPDLPNWKEQLEAIVVIQLRNDGELEKNFFEKISGNKQFDQYVMKAVNESLPMPPFPPEIKEPSLEIGLRFQPGKLF